MIIDPLTRHLAVCSMAEVQRFLDLDRNFWHIISIRDTARPKLALRGALSIFPQFFDDVEVAGGGAGSRGITEAQAAEIWNFVNRTSDGALLIHCVAGLSRSAAVAAAVIVRSLTVSELSLENISTEAVDRLLAIRPPACPNSLVLLRLLEQVMDSAQARQITAGIRDDDRILHNRFVRPH